jgi:uncharacterized protein
MEHSMTVQIFLDTGYFIALLNERDQYHEQAVKLSEQYDNASFITTDVILLELGNALSRSHKSTAITLINCILADERTTVVHLTPEWFAIAFERYQRYLDQSWGLVDCFSFVVMEHYRVSQALTFDQHFTQAGFQVLTTNRN